ncbi:hypothetical protein WICPIJ_003674 [Wickerhamomyces pijperi]|uniref:Zinc transporter n=1 Tax=Wickerhamomyces pijperi TaxID=599730 RepID=A0A9P8Q6N3_WICPI|nr:hypothetical protein WICPIJ_003674 [Wickerhamomyces pijperi]
MPTAPITSKQSMPKQQLFQIQNIPILLTYPTLLLSSSLVIEYDVNKNKDQNDWKLLALSLLISPVFLGSCLSILGTFVRNLTMSSEPSPAMEDTHSHNHNHSHNHSHSHGHSSENLTTNTDVTLWQRVKSMKSQTQTLLTLFALFTSSWILDPIRTVSLTLVLIQTTESSLIQFGLVCVFFVFDLVELMVRYGVSLNYQGLKDIRFGQLLILGYLLCVVSSGRLSLIFQGLVAKQQQPQQKNQININKKSFSVNSGLWFHELILPGLLMLLSGLTLLFSLKDVSISMILITLGCGLNLLLSQTEDLSIQFNSINIIVSSLLSYMLEVLSFKKQFHPLLAIVEVLVISLIYFLPIETKSASDSQKTKQTPSLITQLITHPKTKPIFSFLLLNTTFMFIQLVYSFRSQSLGLLSDSLHMALDSTSLFLGLLATILASNPPSTTFPFGLKKLETLAGFANGVLLIGIVFGILLEAVQRLFWPVEIQRTSELLIVAALGLVVNIVGIFAFNHGHGDDGHGHGHSHGHSHSHGGGGDCDGEEDNENMRGIFLHILADTLGSLGVVVSTILIQVFNTPIFDPISSLFIAVMIFGSAIPLIKSSASRLLLNLNDKEDDQIKDLLSQVMNMPGVISYTTPRFWSESNVLDDGLSGAGESYSVQMPQLQSQTGQNGSINGDLQGKVRAREETFSFAAPTDSSLDVCHEEHEHGHSHTEHSHSHSSPLSEPPTSSEIQFKMIGYIHIQHLDGENSTIIKKRVEKIFENAKIKCSVQVEKESDRCWCRESGN